MQRGTICVERSVRGELVWCRLYYQHQYREWTSCFSVL